MEISEGPILIINEDLRLHGSAFCNDYNGSYEYVDSDPFGVYDTFRFRNIVRETENCGDLEEMESHFLLPFFEEKTADIYPPIPGGEKEIVLHFITGYQVYKNFPALATNELSLNDLTIFPNPVMDKLTISSNSINFDSLTIKDVNGRAVNAVEYINPNELDISDLAFGMYFLHIQSSEGKAVKKFIKK